jgi:hypothetical protein
MSRKVIEVGIKKRRVREAREAGDGGYGKVPRIGQRCRGKKTR